MRLFLALQALCYLTLWLVILQLTRPWQQIRNANRDPHVGKDCYTPERRERLRIMQAVADPATFARHRPAVIVIEAEPPQTGENQ